MLWIIIIFVLTLFILFIIIKKFYFIKVDHTLMFTGAPGTGKTNEAVKWSLRLYRYNLRKWKRQRNKALRKKQPYPDKPQLYSNIPIRMGRFSKKEFEELKLRINELNPNIDLETIKNIRYSNPLKIEHLLNQERIELKSVVFVTELGKVASQYDWQNMNVQKHLDDFISLYRQYTQGGYFICDDQSSDNIAVTIRRRLGTVINMLHLRKFWKVYWVKMRNITISEDIKTIEDESAEDSMRWRLGLFPLFTQTYDTYAFSQRYDSVPSGSRLLYISYKTNKIINIPKTQTIKISGQQYTEGLLPVHLNESDPLN